MLDCIFLPQNGIKYAHRNSLGHKKCCLTKRQGAVKQLISAILPPNGIVDWSSAGCKYSSCPAQNARAANTHTPG